jgi:hypothetical protein
MSMPVEQYRKMKKKANKFNAVKTEVDGIRFDSRKEADYYRAYKTLEEAGAISQLECQPRFVIVEKDKERKLRAITYVADFCFLEHGIHGSPDKVVAIDVKGMETPVFRLKFNLVQRKYPEIEFRIVR